jgi:probable HAF family extracellular repeat protein
LFVLVAAITSAEAPQNYRIVDLPALQAHPNCPTNSNATAINERGDVVGVAETSWYDFTCHFVLHAVIWRNGEIIDLGGIPPYDTGGYGKGINDNGDAAVGWAGVALAGGGGTGGAFFWKEGDGMSLIHDGDDFPNGQAWGVNNSYQVAVTYKGNSHYWDATTGLRLIEFDDSPDNYSSASWEINNNGIVVGSARRADYFLHSFRYDPSTDTIVDLHDIAFRHSEAYGLNDNGDIAGWIEAYTNEMYAAIWPVDGGRIDLPVFVFGPGYAYSKAEHINDLGDVVGTDVSAYVEPAIGWVNFDVLGGNTDRVKLTDLLSPADAADWTLTSGFEINNARQITGTGIVNGRTRGYLMTPVLFEDGFESGTTDGWSVVQP